MDTREILNFCIEKGLLLDREVLNLFEESVDSESAKLIIEKIREQTRTKVITKTVFNENREKVRQFFSNLPEEKQQKFRKLKIRLGLNIEISKEIGNSEEPSVEEKEEIQKQKSEGYNLKINSFPGILPKKPDANDFTNHFKSRLIEMSSFLQAHSELTDLVSINKISGSRQGISIIGIVADKRVTKNKNIIIDVEDLTGRIKVLINHNRKEVYEKAEDIALDSVIGIKCSGSREIVFVNDIVFPDSVLPERKNSPIEEYALFISDVHIGSKLFLEKNFLKFIDYLNGKIPNTPEVSKIKYLFIVGDLVAGVGIYPNQERDLVLSNLEEQFARAAELLGQIRKDIAIIISPGNHDGIRLAEPQPTLDEKYAWPLFNLENVFMTGNPCEVNLGAVPGFGGFNVLTYHGVSYPYYADSVPKLMQADSINSPDKIMTYLLMNRHLAPSHKSVQYLPSEKDDLIIRNIPDILVSGHIHKMAVVYYKNILVISGACWEKITPYQEKLGNRPDFCKVPMINLKTRQVRILDFE